MKLRRIVNKLNILYWLYAAKAFTENRDKRNKLNERIIIRKELGFDDQFMKLNIKW
ncbi:hypothetical protein MUK66_gp20 [Bacillus phage Aurora]|uniref:Uncharacterized protein n=1 Tax=Bacillus phage Aurora TaxID=1874000 RepID=A0A1B1PAE4_9CAUD|nr:hypothetical protein MUK66_gp20 [Bacillus phage Aurora]ANT41134.1 hypothetical protein AURORA_20 [Bacillus phage Aurora]